MGRIYSSDNKTDLENFITSVAEEILQENMSLFLAAGSSMQYSAPSWSRLMAKVCEQYIVGDNVNNAQYAELKGIDIKSEIAKEFSSMDTNVISKKETYLNYLLDFNFKSIWTTNYDMIIEKVLLFKSKKIKAIYQYSHFQDLSYPGGYFLFKINGSCDCVESIVATKEDFINYKKTHEAYLILLKRELLCHSFLFLGASFEDDILRMCIKDILNCINNSKENFTTKHYAIIAETDNAKRDFISSDLAKHYNINCLTVSKVNEAYRIAYGISSRVKYNSIFISGARKYKLDAADEDLVKKACQNMVGAFMSVQCFPYKFISGMGMSIGHFICGTVKRNCEDKNINRFLQMEPFPFTSPEDNNKHRENMIKKAGIFIFIFGDYNVNIDNFKNSGMWKEYLLAKSDEDNIIIPLPCGENSISNKIYQEELLNNNSFSDRYRNLLQQFDYKSPNREFFNELVEKVNLSTRKQLDKVLDEILQN